LNKREAKKIAEEDTMPYGVLKVERGTKALYKVSGYRNAKIIRGSKADGSVILTASEMRRMGL
jgi:hypothetical protein